MEEKKKEQIKQIKILSVFLVIIIVIAVVVNTGNSNNNIENIESENEINMSEIFIDGVSQSGLEKLKSQLPVETYDKYEAIFEAIENGTIKYVEGKHLEDYDIDVETVENEDK